MLRFLLLVFFICFLAIGFREDWLVINWGYFLHDIGLEEVDRNKTVNWSKFIRKRFDID